MMDLGPHAAFIWGSYAAVAVIISALGIWLFISGARLGRQLEELERRGAGRRNRSSDTSRGR